MKNKMKLESGTSNASTTNEEGLDFVLSHFQEPIWPRTISTADSHGAQVLVYSKEKAVQKFAAANMLECRINAFPAYTQYKGINRQAPNFIFIDLDKSRFNSEGSHKRALAKTSNILIRTLGGRPTVLWSGNGFHIYQPINAFVLEQEEIFSKFERPSKAFLRFAEWYLSNGKCDMSHNTTVSFRNCMVRIPGLHNAKYLIESKDSEVKTVQKWDDYRPDIRFILGSFYAWLVDQKIKNIEFQKLPKQYTLCRRPQGSSNIQWIERLLQTPIQDHRKFAVWRILAPYLLNVRKLSYEEGYGIIEQWLDKCNHIKRLGFNPRQKIKEGIRGEQKAIFLSDFERLRSENMELYEILLYPSSPPTAGEVV